MITEMSCDTMLRSFFPGKPTPTVSWFVNERLVDGLLEPTIHHDVFVNRLEVSRVTREHLNTTYKCQASNTKLMLPVEKTVRLELYREYHIVQGVYNCLATNRL